MRTRPDPTPAPGDSALRGAVLRDLAGPLAALRASLESLAHDTEPPSPARLLRRALAEVVRLERRVEALAGLVGPPALHPVACTVEEVARAALRRLSERDRARVWLALEHGEHPLAVDAASLARILAALLGERVRRAPCELLLHSCCDAARVTFTIIDDLAATEAELPDAGETTDDPSLELLLAKREADRMGGSVRVERVTSEHRSTSLEIPLAAGGVA